VLDFIAPVSPPSPFMASTPRGPPYGRGLSRGEFAFLPRIDPVVSVINHGP
jgi:hypothetical protein